MHCPFCNHTDTQVMETRVLDGGDRIRRRRRCTACDRRFTTYERVELSMPDVIKSDGRRVPYERSKLEYSMRLALRKRPVSDEALENALDQVETRLFKLGVREIPSQSIGEQVMGVLRELDTVAYIRFASVYRQFEDIEAFADAIQEIGGRQEAAGQAQARPVQTVLDLVPQVGPAQGGLHQVVGIGLLDAPVVEAHAGQDVLGDGHGGERVGPLEDHADGAAHLDGVDAGPVEVDAVDDDLALDAGAGDGLVHAVEGAQEGGLPAAGGADEGGDGLGLDDDVDVLHGQEVAVVDVLADDVDALGHVGSFT